MNASHTTGICRSRLPFPRTDIENRSRSMSLKLTATTSLTRIPVAKSNSTSAVSLVTRRIALGVVLDCMRVERSSDFTVAREIVRGRLKPTLTWLRSPANGLSAAFPSRSRLLNMDLIVANRLRTVRGFAVVMLPSQRRTRSRPIALIGTSVSPFDTKVLKCLRSCSYALRVRGLSFRWSRQCVRNHSEADLRDCIFLNFNLGVLGNAMDKASFVCDVNIRLNIEKRSFRL